MIPTARNASVTPGVPVREHIAAGDGPPLPDSPPGILIREFVSGRVGATGLSTGTATFAPLAELPWHIHDFSEVITILEGVGRVFVESRVYNLGVYDSIHIPRGTAHAVRNESPSAPMVAHWAFASSEPSRHFVDAPDSATIRDWGNPEPGDPEHITRFQEAEAYELSPGALFRDLFAGRFGAVGVCGGYGRFQPGASLPCHFHDYDESITIVEGSALCLVEGSQYRLSGCDTALVPEGRPHRFINQSDTEMAMIWVYAGSEPERTLVEADYCAGILPWPGPGSFPRS